MKKASRAVVVNTKQDLGPLSAAQLKRLRERADEMGLTDFRKRIDEHVASLRGPRMLNEREEALKLALGEDPPMKMPKTQHAFWNGNGLRLAVEIPEGEIEPGKETGWVWAMSAAGVRNRKASLRSEHDIEGEKAFAQTLWCLNDAYMGKHQVKAIMYRPLKGGGKHYRVMPLMGRVVEFDGKRFRVEFKEGDSK
jgi:hypothetical protein